MKNIDHELKIIFLHPPKNAGKSIEHAVFKRGHGPGSADHSLPKDWYQRHKDEWLTYFKFGFTRNPCDRVVSNYTHRMSDPNLRMKLRNVHTFEDYIAYLEKLPQGNWINNQATKQISWFYFKNSPANFIGKFENIKEDFEVVKKTLNLDCELPHVNKHDHDHYSEYYTDSLKDKVYNIFKEDVNVFEYEF